MSYQTAIGLVGGLVVVAMGITTYRTPIVMTNGNIVVKSLRRDFAAAFTIAMTNPATMIAAIGVFAAFGPIDMQTSPGRAFWLVLGVLSGSALWWLILSGVAATLRNRFLTRGLPWLNKISGTIIAISGVVVLAAALVQLFEMFGKN
jgi:threonine/homoserine/homoserine lactone efflux protein